MYFVSHWWSSGFNNLVTSLTKHCESIGGSCSAENEKTYYYWICAFANDQYNIAQGLDLPLDLSAFNLAINIST